MKLQIIELLHFVHRNSMSIQIMDHINAMP